MAVEFGALQAGVSVNDLSAAVVAIGAATGGINGEEVSVGLWSLAVGFFFTLSGAKGLLFKVVGHWSRVGGGIGKRPKRAILVLHFTPHFARAAQVLCSPLASLVSGSLRMTIGFRREPHQESAVVA